MEKRIEVKVKSVKVKEESRYYDELGIELGEMPERNVTAFLTPGEIDLLLSHKRIRTNGKVITCVGNPDAGWICGEDVFFFHQAGGICPACGTSYDHKYIHVRA